MSCPRRGLSREEAATYIGVSSSFFDELVKSGTMPKPIRIKTRTVWDVHQLDQSFEELSSPKDNHGTNYGRWSGQMVTLRLRFTVSDKDRHGNIRYYFRRKGEKKVRLDGTPGSTEFIDAYQKALAGLEKSKLLVGRPAKPGSFGHVCTLYYSSAVFGKLNVKTQIWRRRVIDEICRQCAFQLTQCGLRMFVSYAIRRPNSQVRLKLG